MHTVHPRRHARHVRPDSTRWRLLPLGIREEGIHDDLESFTDQYSGDGHIRLAAYSTKPADRDMIDCQATLAVADDLFSLRAATGPVGAMTSILHDIGAPVAIVELRQQDRRRLRRLPAVRTQRHPALGLRHRHRRRRRQRQRPGRRGQPVA